jgi:hypothetical protein
VFRSLAIPKKKSMCRLIGYVGRGVRKEEMLAEGDLGTRWERSNCSADAVDQMAIGYLVICPGGNKSSFGIHPQVTAKVTREEPTTWMVSQLANCGALGESMELKANKLFTTMQFLSCLVKSLPGGKRQGDFLES